jgi:hypothetical protein
MFTKHFRRTMIVVVVATLATAEWVRAETESDGTATVEKPAAPADKRPVELSPQVIELVKDQLTLSVPGEWPAVKPGNRIIEHEFSIPPAGGDEAAGRMTIMSAGGSIDANIARWVGQFRTPDGQPLGDEEKKTEKKKFGIHEVHLVDLSGEFQDQPRGPFGPKVARPDYRMLAAIIPVEKNGTWFVKLYGPKQTIRKAYKQFQAMIGKSRD